MNTPSICKLVHRTQPIAVLANQLVNVARGEAPKLAMLSRRSFSWLATCKVATTDASNRRLTGVVGFESCPVRGPDHVAIRGDRKREFDITVVSLALGVRVWVLATGCLAK
jgi:hypothetical protein